MHLDKKILSKEHYLILGFILIVITLPLQNTPGMYGIIIPGIRYTDELSGLLGILIIGMTGKFWGGQRIPNFFYTLIIFTIVYVIIGILDHVTLLRTSFGLFDSTKAFLPVIVAYYLSWKEQDTILFIKSITLMAGFLAIIGIIFGGIAEITHSGSHLIAGVRYFGINRLVSLTGYGNWNYFGIYLILAFFLIPIWESLHIRTILRILIIIALIWTQSRQAFIGFAVVSISVLPAKYKVRAIYASIIILITALCLWPVIGKTILPKISMDPNHYYRLYAFIALWKTFIANPWIGHGPTTAGSLGSIIFNSSFYSGWPNNFHYEAFRMRTMDQYWMVILAETGILGTIAYLMVFIKLRKDVVNAFLRVDDIGNQGKWRYIGRVLSGYMLAIWIMGLFGGLNSAFVVWTYFGLTGAYLSFMGRTLENSTLANESATTT